MLVKDMVANKLKLPQAFIDILPKVCPDCGADMTISDTLRELGCDNPYCKGKVAQRMTAMLVDMGVKNMGENRCLEFIEQTKLRYPSAILQWEPKYGEIGSLSVDFLTGIKEQIDTHRDMMLWEYIKYSNIPYLRDTARELFKDYQDLDAFYAILEAKGADGVAFIQKILGIADTGVSVRALNIFNSLITYKEELLEGLKYVNIIVPNKTVNVCISTSVGSGFSSKADFINQMNQKYGDKVHINFLSAVTANCNYLIWSKVGSPTSKVKKAQAKNIPIYTGVEFEQLLQKGAV